MTAGEKPFPPGDYPVVVIGSGPGGLQTSYRLSRLGVAHAVLSADEAPGGMFRRFPLFQRLITWTKIHAPAERGTRHYEWYDWNSLLGDEPAHRALVPGFMDGVSYFPARAEMERGLAAFAERTGVAVRYGCAWESTRADGDRFVVVTSDGEYRAQAIVVAVGMTQAWKPPIDGMEAVPHYVDTAPAREYAGKRVFIVGKRNSGFELADALLPWARQITLGSPRPARLSVLTRTTASARARYLQPYEDHVLGGGNLVLDCAIDRVEKDGDGWRVVARSTTTQPSREMTFDVDAVIAATGFTTPLGDLPRLGVRTFYQGRLPAQTPFFESASLPGVYFAGSITQGAIGLKKYGIPANSAAVHGFRYNARVLAEHVARTRFGVTAPKPRVAPEDAAALLCEEATTAPELWNQQSYLARVLSAAPDGGYVDEGVEPLAHFVDTSGPPAIAITVESTGEGEIRPAAYVRHGDSVEEHILPADTFHDFRSEEHRRAIESLLRSQLAPATR